MRGHSVDLAFLLRIIVGKGCFIKGWVIKVHIFTVHLFFAQPHTLAEALEMDHFSFAQEPDHVVHVRIVAETENVVVGFACLLFCCHVFTQVSDHITRGLNGCSAPRETGCGGGIYAGGVVYKISGKIGVGFDLLFGQVARQLMHNGCDHLHVAQFLCTYKGVKM